MFRLQLFGSLSKQRKALLAANSFAPIPLHPAVQRQLDLVSASGGSDSAKIQGIFGVFYYGLYGIKELVIESIAWNAVSALIVLGTVLLARQLFEVEGGLTVGSLLIGGYLILKVTQATLDYKNTRRRLQIHRGIQLTLYRCINVKLLHIDPNIRKRFSKGQLKTLIGSDVEAIEDFLSAALQQWVPTIVSSLILVPALYVVSGTIGLVALLVVLLLLPVAMLGAACVEYFQKLAQAKQDELTTIVGEWVKNIRLVRFLGWGRAFEAEINRVMRRFVLLGSIRHGIIVTVYAVSFSWAMLPLLCIFWLSSLRSSPFNLLEVFSSFWLLDHLINHIKHIPASLSLYGSASAGARRVWDLLSEADRDRWMEPAPQSELITNQIPSKFVLRNVSVSYDSQWALRDLSLEISMTQRTAVVGSVGSGKSTLMEVLVGELPISSGEVAVQFDGYGEVSLWREDAYRRMRSLTAYSPQQPFLSNASMRCNLDLSGMRSPEEVDMAIMSAQLRDDLAIFPRGIEEEVGESGINLSGGQKQRVSLARAFISQRPVLLLDDPLSAVDPRTESLLMNAILERSRGLVLVSHRLAELERCDRVIVLDDGRVVEDGDPKLLALDASSRFSRFLKAVEEHDH